MNRRGLLLLGASGAASALGAMVACGPTTIDDRRRELLRSWGVNTLLPLYADFTDRLVALVSEAGALAADPTLEGLERARLAWWEARRPWKQAEIFAFGPYDADPLRLGPNVDFWPARSESVDAVLAGEEPITPEAVPLLGASAKGLPAIEYLLYQPDVDVAAEFAAKGRRGEYLTTLASAVLDDSRALALAWDPVRDGYLTELTEAGRGSRTYASLAEAIGQMVNRMGFLIEAIRGEKLGRPLGTSGSSSAQPDKVESRYSGRSIDDILDNLVGLERCFFGDLEHGELGLDGYLKWRGRDFSARVASRLEASRDALTAIGVPLAEAILSDRRAVSRAIDRLAELQRTFQVDIINALALTVTFGGNDGD